MSPGLASRGIGVEADDGALGVGAVGELGAEDRGHVAAAEGCARDPQRATDGGAGGRARDAAGDARAGALVEAVAGDEPGAAGELLVLADASSWAAVRATFQTRTSSSTPLKKPPVAPVVSIEVPMAGGWLAAVPGPSVSAADACSTPLR